MLVRRQVAGDSVGEAPAGTSSQERLFGVFCWVTGRGYFSCKAEPSNNQEPSPRNFERRQQPNSTTLKKNYKSKDDETKLNDSFHFSFSILLNEAHFSSTSPLTYKDWAGPIHLNEHLSSTRSTSTNDSQNEQTSTGIAPFFNQEQEQELLNKQ